MTDDEDCRAGVDLEVGAGERDPVRDADDGAALRGQVRLLEALRCVEEHGTARTRAHVTDGLAR